MANPISPNARRCERVKRASRHPRVSEPRSAGVLTENLSWSPVTSDITPPSRHTGYMREKHSTSDLVESCEGVDEPGARRAGIPRTGGHALAVLVARRIPMPRKYGPCGALENSLDI